jgi:hypothetical protein
MANPAGLPAPRTLDQVQRSYEAASTGTPKKVVGGIAITLGGLAIMGAVAAIVVPFFVKGVPNVLHMGQQLGSGTSGLSFSATIGTIATAGTILVGAGILTGGAFLVHKGRKEAAHKEEEKQELTRKYAEREAGHANAAQAANGRVAAAEEALRQAQAASAQLGREKAALEGERNTARTDFQVVQRWVREAGGTFNTNAAGQLTGINLDAVKQAAAQEAARPLEQELRKMEAAVAKLDGKYVENADGTYSIELANA